MADLAANSDAARAVSGATTRRGRPRQPAILVDRVTKQYRRFAHTHRFLTLKSALLGGNLFKALSPDQVFTALDDVSLTVEKGEMFGVIGSNGAGKSTLLKIIAGTSKPTTGEARVDGRVSALIELGAGFHPEISGRENVFINGIMLGLSKQQIAERFDDIVRFAELEDFIDAPVKTYSSGMYMRLGFSVAIHVDPDVLLIDEVLAVGDEAFVHKCLDKIAALKRRGKTILLVTHGLESVRRLCDRALWLHAGSVQLIGDPPRVVDTYLSWVAEKEEEELAVRHDRRVREFGGAASPVGSGPPEGEAPPLPAASGPGRRRVDVEGNAAPEGSDEQVGAASGAAMTDAANGDPRAGAADGETGAAERGETRAGERGAAGAGERGAAMTGAGGDATGEEEEAPYESGRWGSRHVVIEETRLLDAEGQQRYVFACGEPLTIELEVSAVKPVDDFVFGIGIFNSAGVCCYGTNTDLERFEAGLLRDQATVRIAIPALNLVEGTYYLDVAAHRRDGFAYDYQRGLCTFRTTSTMHDIGVAHLPHRWEFEGVDWKKVGGIEQVGRGAREAGPAREADAAAVSAGDRNAEAAAGRDHRPRGEGS